MAKIMKILTLVLLSVCLQFGVLNAQEIPVNNESGLITYSGVIEQEGTADALFTKAHKWFFSYYKNPNNVVKESAGHKIEARPRFKILNPADKKGIQTMAGIVVYTFTTEFKEGRYKYQISNIEWKQNSKYPVEKWLDKSAPTYNEKYAYYLKQVDESIRQIIENYKSQMASAPKKEDAAW
jgi:hypothetical protein